MTANLCSSSGCDELMDLGMFVALQKFSLWHHAQSVEWTEFILCESLICSIHVDMINNRFFPNYEIILKENIKEKCHCQGTMFAKSLFLLIASKT